MKEVTGKYNTAKVFTDTVDENSLNQILLLCNQEFTEGAKIRLMPDVHAGAGCTIGTTMTIRDKIVPNLVGVDIGCGMETLVLKADSEISQNFNPAQLDKCVHKCIPSGFEINKVPHKYASLVDWDGVKGNFTKKKAILSMGTLGGGNHFIEADRDDEGNLYIVVHSGSRHAGLEIANYYQEEAWKQMNCKQKSDAGALIQQLKEEGRFSEIQPKLEELKAQILTAVPPELAYVSGYLFDDYINDMRIMQHFAALNRKAMMDVIMVGLRIGPDDIKEQFTTIHNYIDTDNMILRKGAVSAQKGEKLLIPINMRDGSLVCVGKGNEDWNCSAPHGAGRIMSRNRARLELDLEEFKAEMAGIYSTTVNKDTIDEAPMAYKTMDDIVANISPTADILKIIKPIYNFKAADECSWKKKRN
ncbi:MAG: RtcB family protein [Paludibacteraceae bacterium]|nr:RtcB family protein [Paludibacteraceae bacterium]